MAECFLDLCTCMQRHLCILEEVLPPTPTPSMVVNLNSPSPFMVLPKSPDLDLLIIVLLFVIPKLWPSLGFHLYEHSLAGVICSMFLDTLYLLEQSY